MKSDATVSRSRIERLNVEYEMKIQELQEELQGKNSEIENSTHSLKMRLAAVESANRQQGQEKNEAERQMREEKERLRQLSRKFEIVERVKGELEQKLKQVTASERHLEERTTMITIENEDLKTELQELKSKMEAKEKEWASKLESDSKASEARTKQRIEKMWLEKLRRSEISAAQEVRFFFFLLVNINCGKKFNPINKLKYLFFKA